MKFSFVLTSLWDDELHTATMPKLQNTLSEALNRNLTMGGVFVEMCTYLRRLLWRRVSTIWQQWWQTWCTDSTISVYLLPYHTTSVPWWHQLHQTACRNEDRTHKHGSDCWLMLGHYLLQFLLPKYFWLQNHLDPEKYSNTPSLTNFSKYYIFLDVYYFNISDSQRKKNIQVSFISTLYFLYTCVFSADTHKIPWSNKGANISFSYLHHGISLFKS